jgi:3-oxoacid CoA-transferase subunit A
MYVLERGLRTDLSLVKAWKADTSGNLIYRKTARNFNPPAATCGKVTVAEAEIVVEPGELDPDQIHTPGIFVQRLIHNPHPEKRIERRTLRNA